MSGKIVSLKLCLSVSVIICLFLFSADSFAQNDQRKDCSLAVAPDGQLVSPAGDEKKTIEDIALKNFTTPTDVEDAMAKSIERFRKTKRSQIGEFPPGLHIVESLPIRGGEGAHPTNPPVAIEDIKTVPDKHIPDLEAMSSSKSISRDLVRLRTPGNIYVDMIPSDSGGLKGLEFAGFITSGVYLKGNAHVTSEALRDLLATPSGKTGFSGVTRFFRGHPELGLIAINETDLVAAGSIRIIEAGKINTIVGSYPASLMRFKGEDGLGNLMSLRWADQSGKYYKIETSEIDDRAVEALMALASTFPR